MPWKMTISIEEFDDLLCYAEKKQRILMDLLDLLDLLRDFMVLPSRWASQSLPTLGSSPLSHHNHIEDIRRSVCQMFLGAPSSPKSKKGRSSILKHDFGIPRQRTSMLLGISCHKAWPPWLPPSACEASLHGG